MVESLGNHGVFGLFWVFFLTLRTLKNTIGGDIDFNPSLKYLNSILFEERLCLFS